MSRRLPFTAFNSPGRVKASRDPLRLESTWGLLGREVAGKVTTVTFPVRSSISPLIGLGRVDEPADLGHVWEEQHFEVFRPMQQEIEKAISPQSDLSPLLGDARAAHGEAIP